MRELVLDNRPFPHMVFDLEDLHSLKIAHLMETAAYEFYEPGDSRWITYSMEKERGKQECSNPAHWPHACGGMLQAIADGTEALAALFGTGPLHADFAGGGMHQSPEGARLDLHTDFNYHPAHPNWKRTLNALLYLNHDYAPDAGRDGGELELFHRDYGAKVIPPTFGRLVVFRTGEDTYHGHPKPVRGYTRKSLAVYFYEEIVLDENSVTPHSTNYL